jgi:hypothetical protein
MTLKYTIDHRNGDSTTATSMAGALAAAKRLMGRRRIYRGAEYLSDRADGRDERISITCLDIWPNRQQAQRQNGCQADVVISADGTQNLRGEK